MEGHIYVYGIISSFENEDAGTWGEVNLKDIKDQLLLNKEADTIVVHINSMGGDVNEGFAIHDILRATGKKIITQGEGLVASIATVVFLAGDERLLTENTEFMVHNPWGFAGGDSTDVRKYADQLKAMEDKILNFYAEKTGGDIEDIRALMKEETYMSADTAIEKGFATGKVEQIKAVAKLNINQNNKSKMKNEDIQKMVTDSLDPEKNPTFWAKLKTFFTPKNQVVKQDVAGVELVFPNLDEGTEPEVGETVLVENQPANGEFVMPNDKLYICEDGILTEIKDIVEEEDEPGEPSENEEIAELQAKLRRKDAEIKKLAKDFKAFKSSIETDAGIKYIRENAPVSSKSVGYKVKGIFKN